MREGYRKERREANRTHEKLAVFPLTAFTGGRVAYGPRPQFFLSEDQMFSWLISFFTTPEAPHEPVVIILD